MRAWLAALLAVTAPAFQGWGLDLGAFAVEHPLTVRTVHKGETVDLGKGNQTNNIKDGGKALILSGCHLASLDGIASLMVTDEGKSVAVRDIPGLQLFLNDNQLDALPEEMAGLDGVTFIYLFNNRFNAIPPVLGRMKGLQGMYFTGNQLTEIPAFVFEMRQLRKLQLSRNHLKEVPEAIGQLTGLIHLNLSENDISSVPVSMSKLVRLRVCDLSDNLLTTLPEAFGSVQILYQLRVRNNPMTSLPAGFANMPGTIDITGTRISKEDLPPEIQAKISTEKPAIKPKVIKIP